jgi:hypothetical protein
MEEDEGKGDIWVLSVLHVFIGPEKKKNPADYPRIMYRARRCPKAEMSKEHIMTCL